MNKTLPPQERHQFFQFGLKSLLTATLVISVFFAGRLSNVPEMQKMRAQIEQSKAMAEVSRVEAEQAWVKAKQASNDAQVRVEGLLKVMKEEQLGGSKAVETEKSSEQ